jgi:hypothetical protein
MEGTTSRPLPCVMVGTLAVIYQIARPSVVPTLSIDKQQATINNKAMKNIPYSLVIKKPLAENTLPDLFIWIWIWFDFDFRRK